MNNNTHSCPEKFTFPDVAVIVCGRCKDRFRMTLLVSRKEIDSLVCPKCGNKINIRHSNQGALVPQGQGSLVGCFSFPPSIPSHTPTNYQLR